MTCGFVRGTDHDGTDDRFMSASMVYLLLRQILQMLTQLARDGGAKDVELLVLRHEIAVAVYLEQLSGSCLPRSLVTMR